jgi:hypothetical protein
MSATPATGSVKTSEAQKRATASSKRRVSAELLCDPPGLGGFRGIDPEPREVAMLPMESATWLAPEFYVALPRSAVLRIERQSHDNSPKFATVDFIGSRTHFAPCPAPPPLGTTNEAVPPASDLRPLPWEARAVVRLESRR